MVVTGQLRAHARIGKGTTMNRRYTLEAALALLGAAVSGAVRAVVSWLLQNSSGDA
ncbi:hypothetical protein GCM10010421_09870 [Streptomyces glaucus]|uniref:Secreted protein n=1 Tax=Streptomyces glaucus TaxID=284029 RepID=A0ABN3JBX1_9ACTN